MGFCLMYPDLATAVFYGSRLRQLEVDWDLLSLSVVHTAYKVKICYLFKQYRCRAIVGQSDYLQEAWWGGEGGGYSLGKGN